MNVFDVQVKVFPRFVLLKAIRYWTLENFGFLALVSTQNLTLGRNFQLRVRKIALFLLNPRLLLGLGFTAN
jgi:hypothetical protein